MICARCPNCHLRPSKTMFCAKCFKNQDVSKSSRALSTRSPECHLGHSKTMFCGRCQKCPLPHVPGALNAIWDPERQRFEPGALRARCRKCRMPKTPGALNDIWALRRCRFALGALNGTWDHRKKRFAAFCSRCSKCQVP